MLDLGPCQVKVGKRACGHGKRNHGIDLWYCDRCPSRWSREHEGVPAVHRYRPKETTR